MTRIDAGLLPLTWAVRTTVSPDLLRHTIQRALEDASGGLALAHIRTMRKVMAIPPRGAISTPSCSPPSPPRLCSWRPSALMA